MGGKVIFTKRPRYDIEEIFDREEEIKQLSALLKGYEWVTILGERMSGKTSLALSVANSLKERNVVYVDLVKVKGLNDFVKRLYSSLPRSFLDKVRENLELIDVKIGPTSFTFKVKSTTVINAILRGICKDTVLILDEAQDLKQGINHLISLFHSLLNTCPTLSVIFTGSAIGLIKTLLEQEGEKPLAGRRPVSITLRPWSEDVARDYLERGLDECKVSYSKSEIDEVLRELGTLVGWLNIYGVNRCIKSHEEALRESLSEALSIAKEELNNVIEGKEWRKRVLKEIALGSTWSELEDRARVSTQTLSNFLERLENLFLIGKVGRNYVFLDPVYRRAILED